MSSYPNPDISQLWERPLQPASCPHCKAAHLLPDDKKATLCPACYRANLEFQPTIIRPEPPELLLDYNVMPPQIKQNFRDWIKGVWLRPKELNPDLLTRRLRRTFIPLWLVDSRVSGSWQAQMGFDYQVASSQEIFHEGVWETRKKIETRIRWEPRTGTIDRTYHNIKTPALEEHSRLMDGLGKFDLTDVSTYSPDSLAQSSIRVPNIFPEAAWAQAILVFERYASRDCQIASDAQHVDEFTLQADFLDQKWTQLLLPVYTTAYRDDEDEFHPILINGQNGTISGVKQASLRQARYWSLGILSISIFCFLSGLLFAAVTSRFPIFGVFSMISFASALFSGITAPIPAIWAWHFNRSQDKK